MKVKRWFEKKMDLEGGFLIDVNGVEKETEKAFFLSLTVGFSSDIEMNIKRWVPKSCTQSDEEYYAELEKEREIMQERFEAGKKRHDAAYQFAKDNGVKVRKNFRTATIISKIEEAGLSFN